MKEHSSEYLDSLKAIIERHDEEEARKAIADLHPADIAELYQDLDLEEAEFLYRLLDDETAADVLMELDGMTVTNCLARCRPKISPGR